MNEKQILEYLTLVGIDLNELEKIIESHNNTKADVLRFYEVNSRLTDDEIFLLE